MWVPTTKSNFTLIESDYVTVKVFLVFLNYLLLTFQKVKGKGTFQKVASGKEKMARNCLQ